MTAATTRHHIEAMNQQRATVGVTEWHKSMIRDGEGGCSRQVKTDRFEADDIEAAIELLAGKFGNPLAGFVIDEHLWARTAGRTAS